MHLWFARSRVCFSSAVVYLTLSVSCFVLHVFCSVQNLLGVVHILLSDYYNLMFAILSIMLRD